MHILMHELYLSNAHICVKCEYFLELSSEFPFSTCSFPISLMFVRLQFILFYKRELIYFAPQSFSKMVRKLLFLVVLHLCVVFFEFVVAVAFFSFSSFYCFCCFRTVTAWRALFSILASSLCAFPLLFFFYCFRFGIVRCLFLEILFDATTQESFQFVHQLFVIADYVVW